MEYIANLREVYLFNNAGCCSYWHQLHSTLCLSQSSTSSSPIILQQISAAM